MSVQEELDQKYPEHRKLSAVSDESQAIGRFLDESPYVLCEWDEDAQEFVQIFKPLNEVLADFFGIDQAKIEAEKRAMIDEMLTPSSVTLDR